MNVDTQAKVAISGVFEYRDKDGNLIKSVPFSSKPMPIEEVKEEQKDGDVRE